MIWGVVSPVQMNTSNSNTRTENATVRTYDYRSNYTTLDSDYDYDLDEEYDDYDDYDEDYDENYDEEYDYYYDDYDDDDYDYEDYNYDRASTVLTPTSYSTSVIEVTVFTRILLIAVSVALVGFWVSNVLAIKERVKVVKMLKIVAIVCEVVGSSFVIVLAFIWPITFDKTTLNMIQLYGLTVSGFIMTALAAWIISITHKDFESVSTGEKVLEVKPVNEETKTEGKPQAIEETRVDDQPTVIEETHVEDGLAVDEGNQFENETPMKEDGQPEDEALVVEVTQVEEEPQVENADPETENSDFESFSDDNNN